MYVYVFMYAPTRTRVQVPTRRTVHALATATDHSPNHSPQPKLGVHLRHRTGGACVDGRGSADAFWGRRIDNWVGGLIMGSAD